MTGSGTAPPVFEPPGPGQWVLDTGHFPRPATSFTAELFPEPSREGFAAATAPYGLLLDYIEWAFVGGWGYLCPSPVPAVRDAGELTTERWDALVHELPELSSRLATSESVFERRVWREDLALWEGQLQPSLLREHRRLQRVDPAILDDAALFRHLQECRADLRRSISVHHRLNVTPVLPVGELLFRAREWTGAPAIDVLGLLRGAGPLAVGAGDELSRLADAVRRDPEAGPLLDPSADPQAGLASLSKWPGPVGEAASAYLELVGHWSAGGGFDVGEPSLVEMPGVLLETLRVATVRGPATEEDADVMAATEELRSAVPAADRAEFDELLAESRLVHRVRDERALSCDVWANGLMRRGLLAAGRVLAGRGRLHEPAHAVDATWPELQSLVVDGEGPSADELAARARYRDEADPDAVPVLLGEQTRSPVPLEWLSPGAARTERAFRTYLAAMGGAPDDGPPASSVRGQGASAGTYEGPARVVHGAAGLARIQQGDVLVTVTTSPAFNVVLPLVGAIVTDRGGMLSHAAIVAREYGIPAVVGSGDATQRVPDGAVVRVDGDSGEVTVLGPPQP
ncbi:MAG TPA: PEP-utilizing enzyme [Acidimicrobiales bacterium]|nr:PEP-utilizing enzyme [Acidimicrobiales bacterium]